MLKMGRMCHCLKTLWALDPSDGSVRWSVDRGANSTALAYRLSGSDLHLFEAGADNATHGQVSGWLSSSGASPSREWDYADAGGASVPDVELDADGSIVWAVTGPTLSRLNYDDGTLVNESGAIVLTDPILYKAPSTNMNMHGAGSTALRQYDSSFSLVASRTLTTGNPFMCKPKLDAPETDGLVTAEGSGGFGGNQFQSLDSSLSVLTTLATAVNIATARSAKALIHYSSALRLVTLATMAEDWNQAIAFPTSSILDASYNAYCIESAGIRKRLAASGAVDWTNTDLSSMSVIQLAQDGTNLYVVGSMVYGGDRGQVAAIDLATGATQWVYKRSSDSSKRMRDVRLVGGSVYVCGDRM